MRSLSDFWLDTGDNFESYLKKPGFMTRKRNTNEMKIAARNLRTDAERQSSLMDTAESARCESRHRESARCESARRESARRESDLRESVSACARTLLYIKNPDLERLLLTDCMDSADQFIKEAHAYDPSLPMTDVLQALRNVWIMNILQIIAGIPVKYTQSVFAYSLLYPYTDNYIDDKEIPFDAKSRFNTRLRSRLCGELLAPADEREARVYELISIIEKEYPRADFPGVYESMLCIQDGQIKSLSQQSPLRVDDAKTTAISVEKGGASVLADCFLTCGRPDKPLVRFSYGFGFLLQLIDDLQDITVDRTSGNATLFSSAADKSVLSARVRKLIVFLHTALDYEGASPSPYARDVRLLFENNCMLLIYEAVFQNHALFDRTFVRELKRYSPVRPGSICKVKDALRPLRARMG